MRLREQVEISRAEYTRRVRAAQDSLDTATDETVRAVQRMLANVRAELVSDLAMVAQDAGTWPAYRLNSLLAEVDEAAKQIGERFPAILGPATAQAWEQGAAYAPTVLGLSLPGISTDQLLVAQQLQADLVRRVTTDFRVKASQEIRVAVAGVRSPQAAMRNVGTLLSSQPGREGMGSIPIQAERIVRTEMMTVFNAADQARDPQLMEAAPGLRKWWDSARDSRVRPDHRAADARYRPGGTEGPIALDADFTVGGEKAQGPHDPRLSGAQRIQCRCTRGFWSPEW